MTLPLEGFKNALYVNTGTYAVPVWTEIDLARDVKFTKNKEQIDATSRQSARTGWKASIGGLKDWACEFESLIPAEGETPNAGFAALVAAYNANTTVDILRVRGGLVTDAGATHYAQRVECHVLGGDEGEPLNDVATLSVKLVNASTAPVEGTAGDGNFTPNP